MEYIATAKYVRVTPRKLQLIADSIRRISPTAAVEKLAFIKKSGSRELQKVIASAVANAKNIGSADIKNLSFKKLEILSAGGMKRFRAVSRGMAHTYKKRMSHIRVVLIENLINPKVGQVNTEKTRNSKSEIRNNVQNSKNLKNSK